MYPCKGNEKIIYRDAHRSVCVHIYSIVAMSDAYRCVQSLLATINRLVNQGIWLIIPPQWWWYNELSTKYQYIKNKTTAYLKCLLQTIPLSTLEVCINLAWIDLTHEINILLLQFWCQSTIIVVHPMAPWGGMGWPVYRRKNLSNFFFPK